METQNLTQKLTTEALELLICIKDVEEYKAASDIEITAMNKEIITQDNYMSVEEFDLLSEILFDMGYVDEDYEITEAGENCLQLFLGYVNEKEKEPSVVHNHFSLIDIQKLEVNLENSLFKCSFIENLVGLLAKFKIIKK